VSIEDKVKREAEKRGPYDPEDYFLVKPDDFRLMHKTISVDEALRVCSSRREREGKDGRRVRSHSVAVAGGLFLKLHRSMSDMW